MLEGFFLPIFVFFNMCRAYFFHVYVLFSSGGPIAQSLSVLPREVWERAGEFLSVTSQLRVESQAGGPPLSYSSLPSSSPKFSSNPVSHFWDPASKRYRSESQPSNRENESRIPKNLTAEVSHFRARMTKLTVHVIAEEVVGKNAIARRRCSILQTKNHFVDALTLFKSLITELIIFPSRSNLKIFIQIRQIRLPLYSNTYNSYFKVNLQERKSVRGSESRGQEKQPQYIGVVGVWTRSLQ